MQSQLPRIEPMKKPYVSRRKACLMLIPFDTLSSTFSASSPQTLLIIFNQICIFQTFSLHVLIKAEY
jgi:hypothetical protein